MINKMIVGLYTFFLIVYSGLSPHIVFAENTPHRVLLISSYHPGFPTFFDHIRGAQSVFDNTNITFDVEFMDSKRFSLGEFEEKFLDLIAYKINHTDAYDVVMTADDNALQFAIKYKTLLFPTQPIVFFGVNDLQLAKEQNEQDDITGVIEAVSVKETLEMMVTLLPDIKRIVALVDATPSSVGDLEKFLHEKDNFQNLDFDQLSLADYRFLDFADELEKIDRQTGVLLLSAYMDKTGRRLSFKDSLDFITSNLKQPIFHLWYHGIGNGILGGKVISHEQQAKKAAEIVLRILQGEPVKNIKVQSDSINQKIIDQQVLEQYHLKKKALSNDVVFVNAPHSIYAAHKKIFLSLFLFFLFIIIAFILTAFISLLKRRRLQKSLHEMSELNQSIITNSNLGITAYNNAGDCILANISAAKIVGATVDHILSQNFNTIESWQKSGLDIQANQVLTSGKMFKKQVRMFTSVDEEIWCQHNMVRFFLNSEPHLLVVTEDITDLIKTRQQLDRWARAIELSKWGIAIDKAEDDTLALVNPGLAQMHGRTIEELQGQPISILHEPGSRNELKEHIKKADATGHHHFESLHIRKDGTVFPAIMDVVTLKDDDGNLFSRAVTIIDISERKALEQERETLIATLQKALDEVKTLSAFLPICASCKKIRDDKGYWSQVEEYIQSKTGTKFSHGICPDCYKKELERMSKLKKEKE